MPPLKAIAVPASAFLLISIGGCTAAGGSGTLRAFYCDSVRVNGRDLGRRLVAVSPDIYGDSGFQGVWRMEEQEGAHELVQAALE